MSIKNGGDLLLTKARLVINVHVCYFFCVYVSFYCTFSSSVSPFHYRKIREKECFPYLSEGSNFSASYFTGVFS